MSEYDVTPEQLMSYVDGELDGADLEQVEAAVEGSPGLEAMAAGLVQIGDWVRAIEAVPGPNADRDASLTDRILDNIDAKQAPTAAAAQLRLVAGGTHGDERLDSSSKLVWGVAALSAAAAALALVLGGAPAQTSSPRAYVPVVVPAAAGSDNTASADDEPDREGDVAITAVDFGTSQGSIFVVSAGGTSTPVVWLTDDAASGGGTDL